MTMQSPWLELTERTKQLTVALNDLVVARGQYTYPFLPHLTEGDFVHVLKQDGEVDIYIDGVGALPEHRHDFGSTATSSLDQDDTHLDMQTGQMSVLRFSPLDGFEVEFSHPSTPRQWRTSTSNFRLPAWAIDPSLPDGERARYELASQFWVYEDETPRFDFYATAGLTVQLHVAFWGWRYHFRKVNLTPEQSHRAKILRVNGWPASGSS